MNDLLRTEDQLLIQWAVKAGDILDIHADVLVCSANPFLELSGGVGGALLARYGHVVSEELEQLLEGRNEKWMPAGQIVITHPPRNPYLAVIHAVAVDGFYDSNIDKVVETVRRALSAAGAEGANSVALAALATGYGSLTLAEFGEAILRIKAEEHAPLDRVTIVVPAMHRAEDLANLLDVDNPRQQRRHVIL